MDTLLTANEVVAQLAELARELDETVERLKGAEMAAVTARHAADLAQAYAYLNADGTVEMRKMQATVETAETEEAALVAEATLRYIRARIKAIDTRIDVGRSYGAAVRAEVKTV